MIHILGNKRLEEKGTHRSCRKWDIFDAIKSDEQLLNSEQFYNGWKYVQLSLREISSYKVDDNICI